MRELKGVEERILDRALYLMGKKKSCDISVRAIAKEAHVNVSAINYYFRSKDEMLRLVKEFYIENSRSVLSILKNSDYGDEERLLLAANEIMEYALRFPGNMVIHSHSLDKTDSTSITVVELALEIGDLLQQTLRKVLRGDETTGGYKYMIFTSSINYPTESENAALPEKLLLEEKTTRMDYLRILITSLKSI
ncbi:putative HTH-type transcriptional regulator YttP [compost metagenome]